MTARHPAAWINVIAENRNFDEAIQFLQETWDDLVDTRALHAAARNSLREIAYTPSPECARDPFLCKALARNALDSKSKP